jgi:hypothetical protein
VVLRWAAVAGAVLALVGIAAFAWVATDPPTREAAPGTEDRTAPNEGTPPPSSPTTVKATAAAPAPQSAQQWTQLLAALDDQRESAFARTDARLLDEVYAMGSVPLAADQQAVRSLAAAHAIAPGVRHEVVRLSVIRSDAQHAQLQVTDRMPAYRIVDDAGATVRTVPARGERTFHVELALTPAGWRIAVLRELARTP